MICYWPERKHLSACRLRDCVRGSFPKHDGVNWWKLILYFVGAGLAGCGSPSTEPSPAYPADDRGRIPELEEPPRRIVVLSPSLTEILFALNAEDRIIAVSRYCRWPDAARELPSVGGGMDPSTEKLLSLRPDLVLSSGSRIPGPLARVESAGVPVALLNHSTLDDVYRDIRTLGSWIAEETRAQTLIANLRAGEKAIREKTARRNGPRPGVVVLYDSRDLQSAGANTFTSDLVRIAGGTNLPDATGAPWPILNPESLLRWNPEVIFFSFNGGESPGTIETNLRTFSADPRWENLRAVQNERLYPIPDSLLSIPGPRSIEAARLLQRYLTPETDSEFDS